MFAFRKGMHFFFFKLITPKIQTGVFSLLPIVYNIVCPLIKH